MGVISRCLRRGRAAAACAAAAALIVAGAMAAIAFATARTAAARADYGDAPDGARAGYLTAPGVVGSFPSLAKSNGARHSDTTGALHLGQKFDVEPDSKQVNRDSGDDGFFAQLRACRTSTLTFVIDASGLPVDMRSRGHIAYLNALFDWNRDGRWQGASRCGGRNVPEWLVHNRSVDLGTFVDQPIQAIEVTVPAGLQVKELWIRATLTLDQQMKSGGQGSFTFGETEDYFYAGAGPTPKHKGKHKKKRGKKDAPQSLEVDCLDGFMDHGTTQSFFLFFTDPDTGAWVNPAPGSVDVQVANGQMTFPAVPGDVGVKPFSYGYKVTSKLKDDRANPFEPVFLFVQVTSTKPRERVDAGRWSLGLPISKGVVLGCFVLILHSHHVVPGGGPPGGGPPGGPGQPGGPGGPGPGQTVNQAPTAAFTFTPNNPPTGPKAAQAINFDGSGSSDPDGTVVAWSWSVGAPLHGGGGTSNVSGDGTPHATIRFPTAGVYPVTLTVTDNGGKTSSVTQNVAVSSAGLKSGAFATEPTDMFGCSGTVMATEDIFIPTYAQTPVAVRGTPTGGCAGATITITKITRQASNAPPDQMGNPRLDEWGNVKDTVHIEFTISGGTSAQGTVPFTVSWQ